MCVVAFVGGKHHSEKTRRGRRYISAVDVDRRAQAAALAGARFAQPGHSGFVDVGALHLICNVPAAMHRNIKPVPGGKGGVRGDCP